jgi:hypothetical protein
MIPCPFMMFHAEQSERTNGQNHPALLVPVRQDRNLTNEFIARLRVQ